MVPACAGQERCRVCLRQSDGARGDRDGEDPSDGLAAAWLPWVAGCTDKVTDIPGDASASDMRVHALMGEVQGCCDMAYNEAEVEQMALPTQRHC